ncbi:hypothetical protein G7084_00265 [Weissella coleopterorum]|uniref:Uncharacterized protein n=1 Tax=Weissella coleopterorum TaxID=2714949 RepID=A0A6G8AYD6_9LACO|nr:hypothetical protein [Weissella coleopterorum]QIL49893.1 hypothetical protein G7084_00265 [Weissella coleopterorum]
MKQMDEALIAAKMAMFEIDNISFETEEEMKVILELEAAQQGQINKLKKLKRNTERQWKIQAAFDRMNDIFFEGISSGNFWRDLAVFDLALEELRDLNADDTWVTHYEYNRNAYVERMKPRKVMPNEQTAK